MRALKKFFSQPLNILLTFLVVSSTIFFLVISIRQLYPKAIKIDPKITTSGNEMTEDNSNLNQYFENTRNNFEIEFIGKDPFQDFCEKASTVEGKTFIYGNTVCMP